MKGALAGGMREKKGDVEWSPLEKMYAQNLERKPGKNERGAIPFEEIKENELPQNTDGQMLMEERNFSASAANINPVEQSVQSGSDMLLMMLSVLGLIAGLVIAKKFRRN